MIIKNALAVLENSVEKKDIRIRCGKIVEIADSILPASDEEIFDVTEDYLFPGFIDIHTHGGCMHRFDDPESDISVIGEYAASKGVTGICAGIASRPVDVFEKCARNIIDYNSSGTPHTKIYGIHAEGPFLNPEKRGGMILEYLSGADVEVFDRMYNASGGLMKILTVSPELEGAFEIIKKAITLGVRVSAGHSDASYETMIDAIEAGVSHVTHTFNACPPLGHRQPGMLGAAFADDNVACEVICDFFHVHPSVVKTIHKIKGPDKFVAVSDSVRYAGMEVKEPILDEDREIHFHDGVFALADGTICGSGGSMQTAVVNLHSLGLPLWEISKAVSLNPAREIFADRDCGSIEIGKCADFAILDKNFDVTATFADGVRIY